MKKCISLLAVFIILTALSVSIFAAACGAAYRPFDEKKLEASLTDELCRHFGKISGLTIAQNSFFEGSYYVICYFKCKFSSSAEPVDFIGILKIRTERDGKYEIVQEHTKEMHQSHGIEPVWLYDSDTGAFVAGGRAQSPELAYIRLHTPRGDNALADISPDRGFIAVFPEGEGPFGNPAAYAAGHRSILCNPVFAGIRMPDSISVLSADGRVLETMRIYH